ncbi:Inositol hexakisphosphate and diphosphoinositol-pentakisphosphate kinase [Ceratocystis platani]|uniref:Inositol hexakisphosphate and diphosphoinositol-pentakisphosphate kinase n=1 Tax=Ceratocystis fimbriata f. sp. platani TaxID=88771 RepID=A0A0F8CPP7_CERFI|nr:Inositol hexakisphosphate and diphosphoinositol-pentakisphosphate kinase [Ceratocystis platani]
MEEGSHPQNQQLPAFVGGSAAAERPTGGSSLEGAIIPGQETASQGGKEPQLQHPMEHQKETAEPEMEPEMESETETENELDHFEDAKESLPDTDNQSLLPDITAAAAEPAVFLDEAGIKKTEGEDFSSAPHFNTASFAAASSPVSPIATVDSAIFDPATSGAVASVSAMPEPSDAPPASRASLSEFSTKRASISSIYSLASARGIPSSAASANGSESGIRTAPPGTSAAAITAQNHIAGHDAVGKRASNQRLEINIRQPGSGRERSRANRRFSASTSASSHSPSSDRPHQKEELKPAAWGTIGVCALDVKARSKPSRNILNRLISNREFDIIVFGDKTILDEDVENWPLCDYLICFYSDGFPLDKAIAYVKLRKPFCVNDVPMQKLLWDRRLCLQLLNKIGVPTPSRVEVTRDGGGTILTPELRKQIKETSGIVIEPMESEPTPPPTSVELIDNGDAISVDGTVLYKPFVEKPTSGEDHNIIIYYHSSVGGGARKLFRKIGNKSSEYIPGLNTPRAITEPYSSYIYERFTKVDNAEDVKAYTVGPTYCHAETRKSPVVDGIVRRNTHGKEIRYVTPLTSEEKEMASKISRIFGQRVCGFDLLRASGKSFVIDVNGWSFVKDNDDYYDHCSTIMKELFIKERIRRAGSISAISSDPSARSRAYSISGRDRDSAVASSDHAGSIASGEKSSSQSESIHRSGSMSATVADSSASIKSVKGVSIDETRAPSVCHSAISSHAEATVVRGPERRTHRQDSLSGVTMSRITAAEDGLVLDKLQLIVKWGGEPTHSARYQAQELGSNMHNDLALLNREVLDEVHIYSSSERRVTTSAQIWAGAFLGQQKLPEGLITIRKDLLDDSNAAKDEMDKVKKKLKGLLREGNERPPQFAWPPKFPEPSDVQKRVVSLMKFHRKVMHYNYERLKSMNSSNTSGGNGSSTTVNSHLANSAASSSGAKDNEGSPSTHGSQSSTPSSTHGYSTPTSQGIPAPANSTTKNDQKSVNFRWCCGEDADLFKERWEKLFIEFCDNEKVDPSKISELYDTMKFDALHNRTFLEWVFKPSQQMLEEEYNMASLDKEKETQEQERVRQEKEKEKVKEKEKEEEEKRNKAQQGVRRIFKRNIFNNLRHFGEAVPPRQPPPEQYFYIEEGNTQNKAKVGAEFEPLRELYHLAKVLFDFICPQEYGISNAEKLEIGLLTSLPLLKEIVQDLEEMQASDDAKSFFYFTKESHIYTLLNCILEGGIETKINRSSIPELDYLSQISFELYESEIVRKQPKHAPSHTSLVSTTAAESTASQQGAPSTTTPAPTDVEATPSSSTQSDDVATATSAMHEPAVMDEAPQFAYSIRISISPGCHVLDPLDVQLDSKHCISCAPRRSLTPHADWQEVIKTLRAKFNQVKLPKSFIAINLSEAFSLGQHHASGIKAEAEPPYGEADNQHVASNEQEVNAEGATTHSQTPKTKSSNAATADKELPPKAPESLALSVPQTSPNQQSFIDAAITAINASGEELGAGDVIAGEVDIHCHQSRPSSPSPQG